MIGKDFKGQDLSETDFSDSDIRGADFTNAVLTNANFRNSKAGPQQIWLIFISLVGLVGMAIASLITGYAGGLIGLFMFDDYQMENLLYRIAGFVFFLALVLFIIFFFREGFGRDMAYFAMGVIVVAAISIVLGSVDLAVAATLVTLALAITIVAIIIWSLSLVTIHLTLGQKIAVVFTIVALACAIPGAWEGTKPLEETGSEDLDLQGNNQTETVSQNSTLGTFSADSELQTTISSYRIQALSLAGIVVIIVFFPSFYLSRQIVTGNPNFSILTLATNVWITSRGTRFRGADLSGADFTGASLDGADFRSATLTRTCFYGAKKLERARTRGTYLEDVRIRELVVGKEGKNSDFNRQNLRGVNLKGADLQQANFVGADLSRATMENANLSGAKLAKAQLYHTDLTGANLTGAVIQDWAISTDTVLEDIQCEYIYMRLSTEEDPDPWRKPDNRNENFQEGDFSDFIAPIVKTLDLYQQQNVDPRKMAGAYKTLDFFHYEGINSAAAAVTLKQLAEDYPAAELEVIALEGRGDDKIRLQASVSEDVDRSQLSEKYSEMYKKISSLPEADIQALLAVMTEKDERIHSLEKMVIAAVKTEKFYVETNYILGDKISVGDISDSSGIAIGRDASA